MPCATSAPKRMRKYYPGITLFKVVGSLLVLMGHVHIPQLFTVYGRVPGLQQAAAAVVPCFYTVAGFLAYKGWTSAARPQTYIRHYLGWLVAAYAALSALALLLGNGSRAVYGAGAWHNAVLPLAKIYLVTGPYGVLWFIPPLVAGVAFCYYFQRRGWLAWAVGLALVGFLAAQLLAGTLRVVLEAVGSNPALYHWRYSDLLKLAVTNYLGLGLPFVLLGVLLAHREAAFIRLPGWQVAGVALGGLGAELLLLAPLAPPTYDWFSYPLIVSMVPLGAWLFYGLLHMRGARVQRYHAVLNRFSALLYFLHMLLLPFSLAIIGFGLDDIIYQRLTTGQIAAVMVLTLLQVAVLNWLAGWLLARQPRPARAVASARPASTLLATRVEESECAA